MQRFGSWQAYRTAPAPVVEEQLIAWSARLQSEADQNREQNTAP